MQTLRTLLVALALGLCLTAGALGQAAPHAGSPGWSDEDFSGDDTFGDGDEKPVHVETDLTAVDRAHAAYLLDGELQLERPEQTMEPVEQKPPPGWLQAIGNFLESLGPLFQVAFWLAAALIVAGILYFLFGEAVRLRFAGRSKPRDKREDDVLQDLRPDAAAARSLLDEADALARQGRFAEAVHLLLFRSIEEIQERIEGGVSASLTAREISSLAYLPDRAKRALRPITQVVERSFFGGRSVDEAGWQDARRSYEDFAFGEGWA